MTTEDTFLTQLEAYFAAYRAAKVQRGLTQKQLAAAAQMREGDFSAVFSYLAGKKQRKPKLVEIRNVYRCLTRHWTIDAQGVLIPASVAASEAAVEPDRADTLRVHSDYIAAGIGNAVQESGTAWVWLLNTYLSNVHHSEAAEHNPETLTYWLEQGKQVRALLLHPDRHGMRLRAKSLETPGDDLAGRLISDLKRLLDYGQKYPGQLEVRLMDELPGVSAIILESGLFYGLHLSTGHSENGPFVEAGTHTECRTYEKIRRHFETLWDDEQRSSPLNAQLVRNAENALHGIRHDRRFLTDDGGRWNLYLHDIADILAGSEGAPFGSSHGRIRRWELMVYKPARGVYLRARLDLGDTFQPLEANLITEGLHGREYAHLRFTDLHSLTIHLSFDCRPDVPGHTLMGYCLIASGSDCCAAYGILIKQRDDQPPPPVPVLPYFRRMLAFRDGSYMSLGRLLYERDRFAPKMRFAGTYRVYSYGGKKGGEKGIKLNWLHIDESGVARYKNQRFVKDDELVGRATYIDPNLHITSTYYRHGTPQRRSYLIIGVAQNEPQAGRYYGAVHLGVSWDRQMAHGKRFILEYVADEDFDEQTARFIAIHSAEYYRLPIAVRSLLSGRLKNLNGFLRNEGQVADLQDLEREWAKAIRLDRVFCDSAVQHARRRLYREAVDMLFRAVNHGFNTLDSFEQEVRQFDPEGLSVMQTMENYSKIQAILQVGVDRFDPGL